MAIPMPELPQADRVDVVLPAAPDDLATALDQASERDQIAAVLARDPEYLAAWAALAATGRDPIERYAYARVGYHRGLDALRRNRWGGNGLCRWEHPTNRGFLTCLARLGRAAQEIGETSEVDRIAEFLRALDPDWSDDNVA